MKKLSLFLIVTLFHICIGQQSPESYMIFWNTGQGQWITAINQNSCTHFDFGGEIQYWNRSKNLFFKLCKDKKNILYLTHPDKDHYAYYRMIAQSIADLCWAEIDHTQLPMPGRPIPLCDPKTKFQAQRIHTPKHFHDKNDSSKVYNYKNILMTGDSPQKQEKIWAKSSKIEKLEILTLGHHGSKTSTSDLLLKYLPNLKMAIAQARFRKYGHPHKEVVSRLRAKKIPILRTEEWGNIILQY